MAFAMKSLLFVCVWGVALHAEQHAILERMLSHESSKAGTNKLYDVKVNIDIESFDAKAGITMYFDKVHHNMRLDVGQGPKDGLAWGSYLEEVDTTGWGELYISGSTLTSVSNDAKMYAAGFVEGLLTCVRISQYYANTHQLLILAERSHHSLLAIRQQLEAQVGYVKANVNLVAHIWPEEPLDIKWRHSRYLLFQLWGMMDGYNQAARHFKVHTLSLVDFFLMNSMGEAQTLMEAYRPATVSDRAKASSPPLVFLQKTQENFRKGTDSSFLKGHHAEEEEDETTHVTDEKNETAHVTDEKDEKAWHDTVVRGGRCSAFVRIAEGYRDLYVGHTTWADYSTMTRIWKYYTLPLPNSESMTTTLAMSSYPGIITSGDNYFMADSGLVITDTSLEMVNIFGYDPVKDFPFNPHLPNFMHVIITTRLAKSAVDWADHFQSQNTGTLIAQWMIVDYNLFHAGKPPQDNVLWILEQVPGSIVAKDMTPILKKNGYWASMDRPYFEPVREASGFAKAQKSHGALYSVTDCPRCRIFKDASASTNSLYDMRGLMQRNLYPMLAYEPFLPGHDISARFDLDPKEPIPNGGIDSKITNRCLFKTLSAQVISGPSHQFLKFFTWTDPSGRELWPGYPHEGMPNTWAFNWRQQSPVGPGGIVDVDAC